MDVRDAISTLLLPIAIVIKLVGGNEERGKLMLKREASSSWLWRLNCPPALSSFVFNHATTTPRLS
jgi:hypothetical protein